MIVKLLFFASVRERIGLSEECLELPEGSTVDDVRRRLAQIHPDLEPLLNACRFSVDSEYANLQQGLRDKSEIGVIPPVSGGSPKNVVYAKIVRSPIDMQSLSSKVADHSHGAGLTFAGTVRADGGGAKAVRHIIYEGYEPMAGQTLYRIAEKAAERHGAAVAVEHRLGCLKVGEISIGIAVATAHRAAGFLALREMIEEIKKDLPIWKKEEFSDGTAGWLGIAQGAHPAED